MYRYDDYKEFTFTHKGQLMFLRIRDNVIERLKSGGAITMQMATDCGVGGSNWEQMACVDRLLEIREIREVEQKHEVNGQNRLFMKGI